MSQTSSNRTFSSPSRPRVIWDMTFTVRSLTGTRVYTQKLFHAIAARPEFELSEIYGTREVGAARHGTLRANAQNILWLVANGRRELNRQRPALFHAAAFLSPLRPPCPMVLNLFDTTYVTYPRNLDWKFRFYANTFIPASIKRAAAILTLSEHARGEIVRIYNVSPERVYIVTPGVGAEFHLVADTQGIEAVRTKYGLGENYLIYVGGRNRRKNVPNLIRAFAKARGEFPALEFVMAGPKESNAPVDAALAEVGLAHAIHQLDYVPEADLHMLYAGARADVFASRMEGFGMPPVEAMACGTPVVAAPNAPMPQVLGDAAWFTENDSPDALAAGILRVLNDDALAQTLRARGLERARLYTWEGSAQKTIGIYQEILARTPHAA